MELTHGSGKLNQALKALRQHWGDTRERWDDAVARDFEDQQVHALDQYTLDTLREIDRLGEIMSRCRRECS